MPLKWQKLPRYELAMCTAIYAELQFSNSDPQSNLSVSPMRICNVPGGSWYQVWYAQLLYLLARHLCRSKFYALAMKHLCESVVKVIWLPQALFLFATWVSLRSFWNTSYIVCLICRALCVSTTQKMSIVPAHYLPVFGCIVCFLQIFGYSWLSWLICQHQV